MHYQQRINLWLNTDDYNDDDVDDTLDLDYNKDYINKRREFGSPFFSGNILSYNYDLIEEKDDF